MTRSAQCTMVYAGPSVPELHGTRCQLTAPHFCRHVAYTDSGSISWWSEDQKQALRAERQAAAPPESVR